MNTMQQGIAALLKSAVLQQPQILPEGFDLEAASQLIRRHHIVPLAYAGAVQCGIARQHPVMKSFFLSYCKAMQISERQMKELRRLFTAFEEKEIDYMPLKGSKMKSLYPAPELRMMGDADILIRMEQYKKIKPILEDLGFTEKSESDHELVWQSDGLYLELHKRLIPSYNRDFDAYFGDGWQLARRNTGTCWLMTPEDEWIYLFTHFAKHFRDGGIGCRHVVDLWVYRRANPDMDEAYIVSELKKLHLQRFYENICCLMAVWFEGQNTNPKVEFLTEFVFASGSWGELESRVISRVVRDAGGSAGGIRGKLAYIWQIAFPSLEVLRGKYRILKRMPWLLPAVWVIRPFYKILFERRSLNRQKKELDAIRSDNLQERQQMLTYVGLDYNF